MMLAEGFGFVGGALSMLQAVPQVRRVRALGHGRGVSLTAWQFTFAANITWLGYGLRMPSPSLVVTNMVTAVLSAAVIVAIMDARFRPVLMLPVLGAMGVLAVQVIPEAFTSAQARTPPFPWAPSR